METEFVVVEAAKLEDGIAEGMKLLKVADRSEVDVEVIEEGKAGIFGIASKPYKLKVSCKNIPSQVEELAEEKTEDEMLSEALDITEELHGYYLFEYTDDGVYLKVFPAGSDKAKGVALEEIFDEVKHRKIKDVSIPMLKYVVERSEGVSVKIAEKQEEPAVDAEVKIEISDNEMQAFLTILPPIRGKWVGVADIKTAINEKGIIFGVKEDAIISAVRQTEAVQRLLIAEGITKEESVDAKLQFHFNPKKTRKPTILEDGKVDYYNLDLVENIVKGQLLASKSPVIEGRPGMTVTGKKILPRTGKNIALPTGKNVTASPDGLNLYSAIDGQIVIMGNKINIFPTYEIRGDVDLSTGNISFVGNVIIRGQVQAGFTVKADGDVEVHAGVESAFIEAGGNVIVRGGIMGQEKGYVKAEGDVLAKFIENAHINAKKNVQAGEAIMHSRINAGERVVVAGRKGLIVGGVVRAGEEVSVKTLGSSLATPTDVEVGVNPMLREELITTDEELKKVNEQLDKTSKAINVLKVEERKNRTLPPDKKDMLLKMTRAQFHLIGKLEGLKERKKEIEEELENLSRGKVKVSDRIYQGVKVTIGKSILRVRDEIRYATLYREDGEIKVGTYA